MAAQKAHRQVALQKLAYSYYMYIHLLWVGVKQRFSLGDGTSMAVRAWWTGEEWELFHRIMNTICL
jgi:hypothetical protein